MSGIIGALCALVLVGLDGSALACVLLDPNFTAFDLREANPAHERCGVIARCALEPVTDPSGHVDRADDVRVGGVAIRGNLPDEPELFEWLGVRRQHLSRLNWPVTIQRDGGRKFRIFARSEVSGGAHKLNTNICGNASAAIADRAHALPPKHPAAGVAPDSEDYEGRVQLRPMLFRKVLASLLQLRSRLLSRNNNGDNADSNRRNQRGNFESCPYDSRSRCFRAADSSARTLLLGEEISPIARALFALSGILAAALGGFFGGFKLLKATTVRGRLAGIVIMLSGVLCGGICFGVAALGSV